MRESALMPGPLIKKFREIGTKGSIRVSATLQRCVQSSPKSKMYPNRNVIAAVPGVIAGRMKPAVALRAE